MKTCPMCNKEIATIKDYCSACGTELIETWKYGCLKCGHRSDLPDKFCTLCGSPLFVTTRSIVNNLP